jgi:hypothetical protein
MSDKGISKVTVDMRKTGGEVDAVVYSLIDHAYDKTEAVRHTIMLSLTEISQHQPELILSAIASYITKRSDKIDMSHRVQLLQIAVRILESARDKLSAEVAKDIIAFAAFEMVGSAEVRTEWQMPASQILVALSQPFPAQVIDTLLETFRPGVEPHYYTVKTFADVAAINSVHLTLRLRDVLNRFIPVLGLVKKAPMQWVFASALGRFAEAVALFQTDASEEMRAQVAPAQFEADMASAFDVVFSKWLLSPEAKVRFAVVESLGYISAVLSNRDFGARLERLLTTYLQMFKKERPADHLPVTLGLSSMLVKAVSDDSFFETGVLLNQVLTGLHELICLPPADPVANPTGLRNAGEVLRCFEILCRALPDQVLTFVVNRFQIKQTGVRVGSLVILRQLVNSLDAVLKDRKSIIMSAVTTLVAEPEIAIRKVVLQLVTAMANQGYLELEGGQTLVRFVVEQCAIKPPAAGAKDEGGAQLSLLKRAAEHTLNIFANKAPKALPVMWPYLLELFVEPSLSGAAPAVMKALGDLGAQLRTADPPAHGIDFARAVNLPSPQVLVARLCVLLSLPVRQKNQGLYACAAMGVLAESLHPALGRYWGETVPALSEHLSQKAGDDSFAVAKWQDTVLKVWRESLNVIDNEQWLGELATVVSQQFGAFRKDSEALRVVHRFLGAVLSRIQNRALINSLLDLMVKTVDHNNEAEQRGCAQGLGMVAAPHLDTVLPKITDLLTKAPEDKKASGGFFSFGAKKETGPEDTVKATAVLAYGYVTAYANPELVISRIDVHILHNIIPLLCLPPADPKAPRTPLRTAPLLRVQLAKALDLIGKAVHPQRLPDSQRAFRLKKRDDLARGLLLMVDDRESNKDKESKPSAELRLLVLGTLATLTLLEPKYSKQMVDTVFDHLAPMYALLPDKPAEEAAAGGSGDGEDDERTETAGEKLMAYVNSLIQSLVQTDPSVDLLLQIIGRLEPLLASKNAVVRQRAVGSYLVALKKFVPKVSQEKVPQKEQCVPELGKRLAPVLARIGDSVEATRVGAVECVQALLYLDQLLNNPDDPKPRAEVKILSELKVRMGAAAATPEQEVAAHAAAAAAAAIAAATPGEDAAAVTTVPPSAMAASEARYPVIDDVVSLICAVVVPGEVVALARALVPCLVDSDPAAALGAARVVLDALAARGSDIKPELADIVTALLDVLKKITKIEVKRAALAALCTVARLHFAGVMTHLLKAATPLPSEVQECLTALADPAMEPHLPAVTSFASAIPAGGLPLKTLQHLMTVINDTPLDAKTATPVVMAATCALSVIFQRGSAITVAAATVATLSTNAGVTAAAPVAHAGDAEGAAGEDASTVAGLVKSEYAPLVATLLMRAGTAHGVDERVSSKQATRAIKDFFKCVEQDKVLSALHNAEMAESVESTEDRDATKGAVWSKLDSATYDDSVSVITKIVCAETPAVKRALLTFLAPFYSQQAYTGQRVVATAMLAEFVSHSAGESELQTELIKFLLPRVADKVAKVRKQALRGLGNLVSVWSPRVADQATAVLSVLSGATEDSEAEVAAALTRVAQVVDSATMGPNLVSICFRMRATFDRKQVKVRRAACHLFAELCRFATPVTGEEYRRGALGDTVNENFHDQVHTNVPIYLVHAGDEDASVRGAALAGLAKIAVLLDPELAAHVEQADAAARADAAADGSHTGIDEDEYDAFCAEAARILARHYGDRLRGYVDSLTAYYSSSATRLRSNGAWSCAAIVRHSGASLYGPDARRKLNLHAIAGGLVKLLDQESDRVRQKVAKALSLLYDA